MKILKLNLLILTSILFYFCSLIIVKLDLEFSLRWLSFTLWILAIVTLPIGFFFQLITTDRLRPAILSFRKEGLWIFCLIVLITCFVSFYQLINYPFVSIYDQVRDGGLNARQIFDGTIKNIFSYDRYESHGLVAAIIPSLFYPLFKNSVLTFRLPSTLMAISSILLIFIFVKKIINTKTAFWSSIILASLPLHLYYGRTEVIVIWTSILSTLILITTYYFLRNPSIVNTAILGLTLGFSANIYAAARVMSLVTIGLLLLIQIRMLKNIYLLKKIILNFFIISIFFFVGFGPTIFFTTSEIFFKVKELHFVKNNELHNFSILNSIKITLSNTDKIAFNYQKSLLVYFRERTTSTHYPDFQPILNPIYAVFFIFGFFKGLFSKEMFLKILCTYILILPLTNSAITDSVNSDNRLLPLLPIIAILTGYGMFKIFFILQVKLKHSLILYFIQSVLLLFIGLQIFNFFENEPATKQYQSLDYLSMHTIYFLKSAPNYQNATPTCLYVSPENFQYFNFLHVKEQYQYFLPKQSFTIFQSSKIKNNEIYISNICQPDINKENFITHLYCKEYKKFTCMKNTPFTLFSESPNYKPYSESTLINIQPQPIISISSEPYIVP